MGRKPLLRILRGTIHLNALYNDLTIHHPAKELLEFHKEHGRGHKDAMPKNWLSNVSVNSNCDSELIVPHISTDLDIIPSAPREQPKSLILRDSGIPNLNRIKQKQLDVMLKAELSIKQARLQALIPGNKSTHELARFVIACRHILHLDSPETNNYSANSAAEIRIARTFKYNDVNIDEFKPFDPKNNRLEKKVEMDYSRGNIYAFTTKSGSETSDWKIGILISIPNFMNNKHCIFTVQPLRKLASKQNDYISAKKDLLVVSHDDMLPVSVKYFQNWVMNNVWSEGQIVYKITNTAEINKIAGKIENGMVKDTVIANETRIFETSDPNGWLPDTNTSQMIKKFDIFCKKNKAICEKTLRKTGKTASEEFEIKFPCISSFHNVRAERNRSNSTVGGYMNILLRRSHVKLFHLSETLWWSNFLINDLTQLILDYCIRKLGRKVAAIDTCFTTFLNVDGYNSTEKFEGPRFDENSNIVVERSSSRRKRSNCSNEKCLSDSYFDYPELIEYFKCGLLLPHRIDQIKKKYAPADDFMRHKRILEFTDYDMICFVNHRKNHFAFSWIDMNKKQIGYLDRWSNVTEVRTEDNKDRMEHVWTYRDFKNKLHKVNGVFRHLQSFKLLGNFCFTFLITGVAFFIFA